MSTGTAAVDPDADANQQPITPDPAGRDGKSNASLGAIQEADDDFPLAPPRWRVKLIDGISFTSLQNGSVAEPVW
ncbi:hypothetical protein K0U00_51380, partial [Paenibacillus sepulcri]|nr:hypothetical protein [Paenibacillus sepulcri]